MAEKEQSANCYSKHRAVVIVTSDTCSREPYKDKSGRYVADYLVDLGFAEVTKEIIADDRDAITKLVQSHVVGGASLVITVGGTGLCPRDVTPEATSVLYDKVCSGVSTALIIKSLQSTAHAALTRMTSGISGACLIVNFPGKLAACVDCMECLSSSLSHALEQVRFDAESIERTHQSFSSGRNPQSSLTESSSPTRTEHTDDFHEQHSQGDVETSSCGCLNIDGSDIESYEPFDKAFNRMFAFMQPMHAERSRCLIQVLDRGVESSLGQTNSRTFRLIGKTLAKDIRSKSVIPPFDVTTMDGFVCYSSARVLHEEFRPYEAQIVKDICAFESFWGRENTLTSSSSICYRVNTGDKVPQVGEFSVIPIELVEILDDHKIRVNKQPTSRFVRKAGSDLDRTHVLKAGTLVGPAELGIIMSMGHSVVTAYKEPVVGVVSTGDELCDLLEYTPGGRRVLDTNRPTLISLFQSRGFETLDFGICVDDEDKLVETLQEMMKTCDVMVVSGGASKGTKDYARGAISRCKGDFVVDGVRIKPGKPFAFAQSTKTKDYKAFFSLPGNPVSAFVTAQVFVVPFLVCLQGLIVDCNYRKPSKFYMSSSLSMAFDMVKVRVSKIKEDSKSQKYYCDGRLDFLRAQTDQLDDISYAISELESKSSVIPIELTLDQQSSRILSNLNAEFLVMVDLKKPAEYDLVGRTFEAIRLKR